MKQVSNQTKLLVALAAVPAYDNPLQPLYTALTSSQPLTLAAIREQTALLHQQADQLEKQTLAVKQVVTACQQIRPIPLSQLPLGF